MKIQKAALLPNMTKPGALRCAVRAAAILRAAGVEPFADEAEARSFAALDEKVEGRSRDALFGDCDVAVVFGGDGSVLSAAKKASETGIPILGVNFGQIGYITELEEGDIELLGRLGTGDYRTEERMMLDVSVDKDGRRLFFARAFNEAVVSRGSVSVLGEFVLRCNGSLVSRYRADGVIVATPTGSTAYSMSAGGPVVDPELDAICVTPVCSHSLASARTLVFGPESVIEVTVPSAGHTDSAVTVDGRTSFRIDDGDLAITLTRSEKKIKLVRFKDSSFGSRLYQKFGAG